MKRSAMPARLTPMRSSSSLSRSGNLPRRSVKRAAQERTYAVLRREFLATWPMCQFPRGCGRPADEIQHLRGRRGERLNATEWWAASCHEHNMFAEEHTGEALAMGWLVRIEGVA